MLAGWLRVPAVESVLIESRSPWENRYVESFIARKVNQRRSGGTDRLRIECGFHEDGMDIRCKWHSVLEGEASKTPVGWLV